MKAGEITFICGKYWRAIDDGCRLNKTGPAIGNILESFPAGSKKIYYTWRVNKPDDYRKCHFYRMNSGFGVQKAILKEAWQKGVSKIVVSYKGPEGKKLFISHISFWFTHSEEHDYVKDVDGMTESYGPQKFLNKEFMEEHAISAVGK